MCDRQKYNNAGGQKMPYFEQTGEDTGVFFKNRATGYNCISFLAGQMAN